MAFAIVIPSALMEVPATVSFFSLFFAKPAKKGSVAGNRPGSAPKPSSQGSVWRGLGQCATSVEELKTRPIQPDAARKIRRLIDRVSNRIDVRLLHQFRERHISNEVTVAVQDLGTAAIQKNPPIMQ